MMKDTIIDHFACTVLSCLLVVALLAVLVIVLDCETIFRESPVVNLLVCGCSEGIEVGCTVGQKEKKKKSPNVTFLVRGFHLRINTEASSIAYKLACSFPSMLLHKVCGHLNDN